MKSEYYHDFLGIKTKESATAAPSVSFALLENFVTDRIRGGLTKRPGSVKWAHTGAILGIVGYSKESSSHLVPPVTHVLRHRYHSGTSYIEKLDWAGSSWSAITQGANVSFSNTGIMTAAQFGSVLALCGGRPAKLLDPAAGSLSRLGGPGPAAAPSWTLAAGSLTGQAQGCYTFYDATTGWESSPSPVTSLTALSSNQITWGTATTAAREGVTHKRLYRSQIAAEGEPPFYRVAEITLATASYVDTSADSALGAALEIDSGDHDAPPTESFLVIEWEGRFWIAAGNALWYSKAHNGQDVNLEYYSAERVIYFPRRITGLAFTADFARLLVFQPAGSGIHYVAGRTEADFEQKMFKSGEGTNFISSVSYSGEAVVYWGPRGPTMITPSAEVVNIGEDIENSLREALVSEYNGNVYIFSFFHPVYGFMFFFSTETTDLALWEDPDTHSVIGWQDVVTGETIDWS